MHSTEHGEKTRRAVCHLTSAHPAYDARIYYKECCTLVGAGYQVTLLLPAQLETVQSQPEVLQTETNASGGVQILTVARVTGRIGRFTKTLWQLLRSAVHLKADVYHFHDPDLIPVGIVLSVLGRRVIYDVHEDVPSDFLHKDWIPRVLRYPTAFVMRMLEWVASRWFFAGVVAATPVIAERFPVRKTALICNFPKLSEFDMPVVDYASRPTSAVYVGYISRLRGIYENVAAFARVKSLARFQLAGSFETQELQQRVMASEGWANTDFHGWLGRDEVANLLANSRVGLVLLHPTPPFRAAYPVKLFEYMLAGIPVIASDFPLWRSIVEKANCGLLVDPLDPVAIATAVDWIVSNPLEAEAMGRRGREAVLMHYCWAGEADKLLELYQRVLA